MKSVSKFFGNSANVRASRTFEEEVSWRFENASRAALASGSIRKRCGLPLKMV